MLRRTVRRESTSKRGNDARRGLGRVIVMLLGLRLGLEGPGRRLVVRVVRVVRRGFVGVRRPVLGGDIVAVGVGCWCCASECCEEEDSPIRYLHSLSAKEGRQERKSLNNRITLRISRLRSTAIEDVCRKRDSVLKNAHREKQGFIRNAAGIRSGNLSALDVSLLGAESRWSRSSSPR